MCGTNEWPIDPSKNGKAYCASNGPCNPNAPIIYCDSHNERSNRCGKKELCPTGTMCYKDGICEKPKDIGTAIWQCDVTKPE
jgi:hypothetical protein